MSRSGARSARLARPATLLGALSLTAVSLTGLPAAATVNGDGTVTVDVLAFNDFHGRIEAGGQSAGAAVLAGAADTLRAANPDTVLVSAGDNIGASTFTSAVQDDAPTLSALNKMDLFASAVGNHEFDKGAADLTGRVSDLANFPYLAANVEGDLPNIDDYAVYTSTSGVSVGFVGVVTPQVPSLVTPAGIEGLTFTDMGAAANRVAAQLSDGDDTNGEADVVVVLAHDGAASTSPAAATGSSDFGRLVTGASDDIDAIVSGHTHLLYNHTVDGMLVTQASQYGEFLTQLSFTVDPETGAVVSSTAAQLDLVPSSFPADAEIAADVAAAKAQADVVGAVPLGSITDDLRRAQHVVTNADGTTSRAENRGGESTLGNFVADVQLWATSELGAQIAFMNPGGLRTDLLYAGEAGSSTNTDGVVTYKEAAGVQPFANTLVTMTLTGTQIAQVLEEQWQPTGASRPFLKLGVSEGFEYTYDPQAPAGERIGTMTLDGVPVDPAAGYTVVVNSFLASGGDNFTTFREGTDRADSGRVDLQAMVDYFAANPVASPDLAQRAVGVHLGGELVTKQPVTIDLSSLAFSTTETQPTTVTVTLGGKKLGSAPVDLATVLNTDEVGRATLTAKVPANLRTGTHELVITTDTGTEVVQLVDVERVKRGNGHDPRHPGRGQVPEHVLQRWADRWAETNG